MKKICKICQKVINEKKDTICYSKEFGDKFTPYHLSCFTSRSLKSKDIKLC